MSSDGKILIQPILQFTVRGGSTKKTDLEKKSAFWRVNGGARTHDNQNHNLALYQLNYAHHV